MKCSLLFSATRLAISHKYLIGREAHIPVEIWHLKARGVGNFGLMPEIIARIDRARAAGVDIAADTYAYLAWYNDLSAFIPPWAHEGGDAKLLERLRDPAVRARLKTELATAATAWDNEWQSVPIILAWLGRGEVLEPRTSPRRRRGIEMAEGMLVKQGHTKEALVKYDEALKYAPNWNQLKEAREAAAKQKS